MAQLTGKAARFLAWHQPGRPLLQPNASAGAPPVADVAAAGA